MIPATTAWQRPALLGALLLVFWFGADLLVARVSARRPTPWWGWSWLGGLATLLAAATALLGGIALGVWLPRDAGLAVPDWTRLTGWLPGYLAGMAAWVALLSGAAWRSSAVAAPPEQLVPQLARLLRDEALLAALRATLTPLLGSYWANWGAVAVRLSVAWMLPSARCWGVKPWLRRRSLLHRSLDLVSTVVVIMTGSAWVGLVARVTVYVSSALARWLAVPKADPASARIDEETAGSADHGLSMAGLEHQREDDQQDDHGGGQ